MVQVDVFWSYGIGASFALAAGRQLRARHEIAVETRTRTEPDALPGDPPDRASLWRNPFFFGTALFAALLFAPSGIYLLWEFPDWETMQVGSRSMPGWLVVGFSITNVTQALVGFLVVQWALVNRRPYLAYLQVAIAYLVMFFILVHGWDGEGYRRFFSPDKADYLAWDGDWANWLTSEVAASLYVMGAVLLPVLLWTIVRWTRAGNVLAEPGERRPTAAQTLLVHLLTPLGISLGLAIVSSLLIHGLGPALGIPAAVVLVVAALSERSPLRHLYHLLGLDPLAPAGSVRATATSTPRPVAGVREQGR